jgi:hypothetical protein
MSSLTVGTANTDFDSDLPMSDVPSLLPELPAE